MLWQHPFPSRVALLQFLEKGFPAWSKFPMNMVRLKKGKGRKLGIKGLIAQSLLALTGCFLSSLPILMTLNPNCLALNPKPMTTPSCMVPKLSLSGCTLSVPSPISRRNSLGRSLVICGWLTNYISRMEGRTESVFPLYLYPGPRIQGLTRHCTW